MQSEQRTVGAAESSLRAGEEGGGEAASPRGIVAVSQRAGDRVPHRLRRYLSLDDFETAARRRLPRMIFGYVDGAVETRSAMRANATCYRELALVPRCLVDVAGRTTATTLFGREYAAPFGISPLGGAALVAYDGDRVLARAARLAGVPMILSASSLTRLEVIRQENPDAWFQAYLAGDDARISAMVERVAAAGFDTLVITVDTPVPGNRENNLRSGFSMPLRVTPRVALDALLHPRWLLGTLIRTFLTRGVPHFENMDATRGPPMLSQSFVRNMDSRDRLAWPHLEGIRRAWKGRLVVKGLLSPHDVGKARDLGVDGIIVSNHGGRQLDYAASPLWMLKEIVASAGGMAVMFDGGIRRGTDAIKALALGADFVFLGRPFLYAAALDGTDGVLRAMALLKEEISRDMALLGLLRVGDIDSTVVRRAALEAVDG